MKQRYSGCHMTIYGTVIPMTRRIAQSFYVNRSLTDKVKHRLKTIDWYKNHDNNISLTARHFGIGRSTMNRWVKNFKRCGILGLNDKSRKPKKLREMATPWEVSSRIVVLRRQYPTWSKYKIKAILRKEEVYVSESTIGRILKRKGLIDNRISKKRKKSVLNPRARFPRGFKVSCPGDMIQIDVKHIMPKAGHKLYQFTAIDVLTKRRVLAVYSSESSLNGSIFLKKVIKELPFEIRNIQTDNGSTFQKYFDQLCKELEIPHYYIYPRSPKQNCYIEISHGADQREFYDQGNAYLDIDIMRRKLKEWEDVWNNIRPHASLNYFTPNEYIRKIENTNIPTKDYINLQT
ncbi:MAG: DDE-type integrase/transposase/recombinase [Candidatus Paceibacterota bacterium]|jgi:transposase InsO family protein